MLIPALVGCVAVDDRCTLSYGDRIKLQSNVSEELGETVEDSCRWRIDPRSYFESEDSPGYCVIFAEQPVNKQCPPNLSGPIGFLANPITLSIVTGPPWPESPPQGAE